MIRFDESRWPQTQPREAGRDTLCRGQGSASWAITERGGEGDGALYQPHLRMACGLSVGWLGCTSFAQGERATEAADGRAVEMDLHHGDHEERRRNDGDRHGPCKRRPERPLIRNHARIHEAATDLGGTSARRDIDRLLRLREAFVRRLHAIPGIEAEGAGTGSREEDENQERDEEFLHDRLSR